VAAANCKPFNLSFLEGQILYTKVALFKGGYGDDIFFFSKRKSKKLNLKEVYFTKQKRVKK
jgi:hypothetical protein